MGKIVDPLENAWVVTQPSTTVPDSNTHVVYTNNTSSIYPNKDSNRSTTKVENVEAIYTDYMHYRQGTCGICGEGVFDDNRFCSYCGAKLEWE